MRLSSGVAVNGHVKEQSIGATSLTMFRFGPHLEGPLRSYLLGTPNRASILHTVVRFNHTAILGPSLLPRYLALCIGSLNPAGREESEIFLS